MKSFFLSLHPGVRIVLILIFVIGILVVLNYQPADQKPVDEFADLDDSLDDTEDTGGQIIYETIEPAPTQELPAPPEATSPAPAPQAKTLTPSQPVPSQPAVPPQPVSPAFSGKLSGDFYSIQIASSQDSAKAQALADQLKKEGFASEVVSQIIDGKTWHRVYVGRFASKEEANAKLPALRQKYKDSFIKFRNG